MTEGSQDDLHARRKQVIGRMLVRAARSYQEHAVEEIRSQGFDDYKLGDNAVLVHLETSGNRISELAARSGLTKQALSQLVRDLEERDIVSKEPDPNDGRAAIVKFTEHGLALLQCGVDVVEENDQWIEGILGERRCKAFRRALEEILEEFDPEGF